jgi:hypothetical protein
MDREDQPVSFLGRTSGLVDGLLRGTRGTDPARPPEERVPLRQALLIALPLAAFYGLCMGIAAGFGVAVIAAVKLPLVLLLSSLICLPSFYVFATLTGSPLGPGAATRSLGAFVLLTSVIWAALAPVTGFFTISTDPFSGFIATMHGLVLALGLIVGILFLGRELTRRRPRPSEPQPTPEDAPLGPSPEPTEPPPVPSEPSEMKPISGASPEPPVPLAQVRMKGEVPLGFFVIWVVVYAFVACQLFANFAPYLESGPFVQGAPRFFMETLDGPPPGP